MLGDFATLQAFVGAAQTVQASQAGLRTLSALVSYSRTSRAFDSFISSKPAQRLSTWSEPVAAHVGRTLTATTSSSADDGGLDDSADTYQWIPNCGSNDTHITGAICTGDGRNLSSPQELTVLGPGQ